MTRRLGKGNAERGRARLALVVVVLLTISLLLGISPGGSLVSVLAAVSGTPTSTSTATSNPAAPATPSTSAHSQIQFINPSAYSETKTISDKNDADGDYHLVAWVSNIIDVDDPAVDFEVIGPGGTSVFSVPGSRLGSSDTFEAKWPVNEADGTYTIHATLFSSSTQISRDTESITVRKAAEAVEMSYPTTAGTLGVYDPPGDAADAGFVIDATTTTTATGVDVFYGTAPPGTEQNWRACHAQVTVSYSNEKDKRIGCTIAEGITPESITGVAAVTTGAVPFSPGPPPNCSPTEIDPGPPPTCPTVDSGDAHRVFGYEQVPTSVVISPTNPSPVVNNCQELTATLTDSLGRPVWRAPVDVHAVGPSDLLQFGDTARTGNHQPPNEGGHDTNEPTSNCGGTGTPPAQAEHNRPGAQPDDKHIESVPATNSANGTDTSGGFIFALRSTTGGLTAIEAWFDGTEDDSKGSEPSGTAAFTWLSSSPTGSRSPSGSVSATASASRSPSASGTSTTSSSPSGGTPASRTITLEASRNTLRFGNRVVLSGVIDSTATGCESGQTVRIHRALVGGDFQEIGAVTSNSDGTYSFETRPSETASYRSSVDPSSSCQGAVSTEEIVRVRVRVKLSVSDQKVDRGDRVRLKATVAPCGNHDATEVALLRSFGGRFREILRKGLNRQCKATFKTRVKRSSAFKVRWPSQDDNHESGVSKERIVEVRGR